MKFSIRDLLLVTVIVALAAGWWVDRSKLAERIHELEPKGFLEILERYEYSGAFPPPTSLAPAPNPPKK